MRQRKINVHRMQDSEAMELHDLACFILYVLLKAAGSKDNILSIPMNAMPKKGCLVLHRIVGDRLELKLVEPPEPPSVH